MAVDYATKMIIDNGFICEDVVNHILMDYLVENQAHWKKTFKSPIDELDYCTKWVAENVSESLGYDPFMEEWNIITDEYRTSNDYTTVFIRDILDSISREKRSQRKRRERKIKKERKKIEKQTRGIIELFIKETITLFILWYINK